MQCASRWLPGGIRDFADQVEHTGVPFHGRRAGFLIDDGEDVTGKLARFGALDRPVPGIVDARRKLVGEQFVAYNEQLQREHADIVQVLEEPLHMADGLAGERGIFDRRTRDAQDSVRMLIARQAIRRHITVDVAYADG